MENRLFHASRALTVWDLLRRNKNAHRLDLGRTSEAGIDATQRLECTHHQPRCHQQDKRQGYLHDDQYTARMVSLFALADRTAIATERA